LFIPTACIQNRETTIRAFIALELCADVKRALGEIQDRLRGKIKGAHWTRPEGTHLTLKFLGEITALQKDDISSRLDSIVELVQSFSLSLHGVGAFPKLSHPRVIWVGLKPEPILQKLQAKVEEEIAPLGFPAERRDFHGHLTLARLEGEFWADELKREFSEMSSISDGTIFPVHQLVLFQSELQHSGAIYTPLHTSVLKSST
jgi:RNA 2',3'-cyclic 3'-phosphodiesterase